MNGVTVFADDLSGAAETASVFLGRALPVTLRLTPALAHGEDAVTVVDLNTRAMNARDAAARVQAALAGVPDDALLLKKVDSKLRGHIGAEVDVMAHRGPVIVAPALPVLGRTVRDGILYLNGVALHEAGSWSAEDVLEPRSVAELFRNRTTVAIAVGADLGEQLHKAAVSGDIAICDASTDEDLDAIVRAAAQIPGAQLVGTAALGAAVARTLPAVDRVDEVRKPSQRVLVVVGTAEPVAAEQVARLIHAGVRNVSLDVVELLSGTADPRRATAALDDGHVVLTLAGGLEPGPARSLSSALARYVADVAGVHHPDLVLTGGETARAVIDALGVRSMRPTEQVHHGAVVSIASDDRTIVTRPGSFGAADSLTRIVDHLVAHVRHQQQKDKQ